jgi:protein SCO1/2
MSKSLLRRVAAVVLAAATCSIGPAFAQEHRHLPGEVLSERQTLVPAKDYVAPDPHSLGGHFELTDHNGRTVEDTTFRGSWMLIYFGYPGCREACPVALLTMTRALEAMGSDADQIQPLFIDFSMEEPDLKGLGQFVGNFHPRLLGLAGTRAQTFAALRQFKVRREYMHANYSEKETGPRIDHTTYFYLVDPAGVTQAYFYHDQPVESIIADIRQHVPARKP